jgi:flagellar hook-basal body complex protein FliE
LSNQIQGVPKVSPFGANGLIPDIPDVPDAPDASQQQNGRTPISQGGMVDFGGLVQAFKGVAPAIDSANKAESAFLSGHGNLLEMALERAKADTLLSLASTTASKATQAASTLMNLQV